MVNKTIALNLLCIPYFYWVKNKGFPRITVVLMLLIPLTCWSTDKQSIPSVNEELRSLSSKIQELNKRKLEQEGQIGQLQLKLRDLDKKVAMNQHKLDQLNHQIITSRKKLAKLRKRASAQSEQRTALRQRLREQLRAAYKLQFRHQEASWLQPSQSSEYLRNMAYLRYINAARITQLQQSTDKLTDLNQAEQAVKGELRHLESLRKQSKKTHRTLQQTKKQRSKAIAELNKSLRNSQKQLENLDANRRQLTELLERLRFAAQNPELLAEGDTDFARLKGHLRWPVSGQVTKTGQAPGVTIYAPEGRKVRAISRGRVVFADWMRGFGLLMIIDHGNGYMSLYGHNQSLFKQLGDWVEAGTAISTTGESGGQAQTGLYFEIRKDAKPIDPRNWCS